MKYSEENNKKIQDNYFSEDEINKIKSELKKREFELLDMRKLQSEVDPEFQNLEAIDNDLEFDFINDIRKDIDNNKKLQGGQVKYLL